jgi:tRNA(Ile)-lysidine synthase
VALLHVLQRLSGPLRLQLQVLHLNHQLRGAESDGDEEFVRALAESLELPCFAERTQLPAGNLEQAARDARREFFFRLRDEHGLDRIALGHTLSDQAETVLFRFLRGSGLTGLAGMRPNTPEGLIRPLLAASRAEVRAWARAEGITWREDSSNSDLHFARNRLRTETIPALLRDYNPKLESVLAHTALVAHAEEDYWEREISTIYGEITKRTPLGSFLQVPELNVLDSAVQRRLVRRVLVGVRGDLRSIDMQHVEAVLAICRSSYGHDRVIIPGVDALRSYDTLLFARPGRLASDTRGYRLALHPGQEQELPYGAGLIHLGSGESEARFCANFKDAGYFPSETANLARQAINDGRLEDSLYVRNWEPGDSIVRSGHKSAEKLKTLFQEERVLLWERRHWPVVVCGDEIVWVRQFGCAAKFALAERGGDVLRLTYGKAKD